MLELFNVDSFEIFNCALCFGFWYSWATMILTGYGFWMGFVFALVGAFAAEMTARKLLFNE